MVCYGGAGNVSYANAYALGPVQDEILTELYNRLPDAAAEPLVSRTLGVSYLIHEWLGHRHGPGIGANRRKARASPCSVGGAWWC